ncbi:MAG: hypothetical protein ACR2I0_04725 [Rhodoferax sp.]
MQRDVKSLLDQAAKSDATLLAMRERLERAETERVPVAWVYGLTIALLLCLAGMAVLWNRRRTTQLEPPGAAVAGAIATPPAATPLQTSVPQSHAPEAHHPTQGVDVDLMDLDHDAFQQLLQPLPTDPIPLADASAHAGGSHQTEDKGASRDGSSRQHIDLDL